MIITIKHRLHANVLFSAEAPSLQQALTTAVKKAIAARRYSSDSEYLGGSYQTLALRGADLAGATLRGANLADINLAQADLRGADLREVNLWRTTLYGADLREADLRGTDLGGAHLSDLNFPYTEADLTGANLAGCRPSRNWTSRLLVAEILRQAAGEDPEKRQAADHIPIRPYWGRGSVIDWCQWEKISYPLKAWTLDTLALYVDQADYDYKYNTPSLVKNRLPGRENEGALTA